MLVVAAHPQSSPDSVDIAIIDSPDPLEKQAEGEKMEKFKENLIIGADGSNALDSDIRIKEVKIAWSAAMQQWPHENQVSKLAEVLVEDKSV